MSPASKRTKVHYAVRLIRAVTLLHDATWQVPCGSDGNRMRLSTDARDVTCLKCRDWLVKNAFRLGLKKKVNRLMRQGLWR